MFTVTATAGDPLSGLDTLAFPDTTSSGAEHTLSGAATATRTRVYTFDQSSIFSATASVTAADRAGNVRAASFGVVHDTTPPVVSIDAPSSSGLIVPISWQGQDSESGVRDYTVRYSHSLTGPWTTWLTGTTATSGQFPGAADQTYYFQVEAVDNVNNTTTAQAGPVTISAATKYYYLGATRVAMRQGDMVHFLHTDHLGSTSLTTDATGAPIAHTRYRPYGEQRWTDGDTPTDFTFTGQRADSFGLLDYNARYYDAYLNRFVSPDSIVPDYANPQSLNRYSYTVNNPLKFRDPTGYAECVDADCKLKINPVTGRMIGGPRIVSREKWGAKPPDPASEEGFFGPSNPNGYATYPELGFNSLNTLEDVVIHHSGNRPKYDIQDVQAQHFGKGMADIGYHFVIGPDGTIYEGRDIGVRGNHAYGNTNRVGVLLMGDFQPGDEVKKFGLIFTIGPEFDTYGPPTSQQVNSAVNLVRYLDVEYGIGSAVGHRDVPGNNTDCPGELALPLVTDLNKIVKEQ